MAYLENSSSKDKWHGLSEDQRRMLKMAYLMGVGDAFKLCEEQIGKNIQDDFAEDLIGAMDNRVRLAASKV